MDHAVPMRVVQGVGDLDGGAQREWQRQRAVFESPGERRAVDILHHQEDRRAVVADVMERADIGVCDAGDGAGFVAKPFDSAARRVHELAGEELEGHGPIESRIARTVDLTHSPGPEGGQDLERAEAGAGGEPHCRELATGRVDREYNDLAHRAFDRPIRKFYMFWLLWGFSLETKRDDTAAKTSWRPTTPRMSGGDCRRRAASSTSTIQATTATAGLFSWEC